MIYLAAIALGALRWPWWSLVPALGAHLAWQWFVDLPRLNALIAMADRPPLDIWDESVQIGLGVSVFGAVVTYVVARAVSTLMFRSRPSP